MGDVEPPSPQALRRAKRIGWIVVAVAIAIATFLAIRRIAQRARARGLVPPAAPTRAHQMLDAAVPSRPE